MILQTNKISDQNSDAFLKNAKLLVQRDYITLSFKYIVMARASSGPFVHSSIFLAQYILHKNLQSGT